MKPRTCHECIHCLVKGDPITCGKLLGEIAADTDDGDEIDTELATGIAPDWAEECEDYEHADDAAALAELEKMGEAEWARRYGSSA